MGLFDRVVGSVKSNLEWKAGNEISSGIASGVSKVIGGGSDKSRKCPKCKKPVTDSALKFCPECGAKLMVTCAQCNIDYQVGTKFCTQCGQALK